MAWLKVEPEINKPVKIIVLSSHTQSLFWFRLDLMKEFIRLGHEVTAIGSDSETGWKDKFIEQGIVYRSIFVARNGLNPWHDYKTYLEIKKHLAEIKPDKIFVYQAKTIIYGALAARRMGITEVYPLVAGLGSIFRGEGLKNKLLKTILGVQYRFAFRFCKTVFFQNNDDLQLFVSAGIIQSEKTVIINGSGVNLEKFTPQPLPEKPAFLYIGRLLKDKGIVEYLEACKAVKKEYPHVRCLLVGPFDTNPSALKPHELKQYIDAGIIEYFGEQTDVRPFIAQCSVYVLPSYHEGTPKTVLEAMAMGRPVITTNAPGCRETVTDGINGFLVSVKNSNAVAEKMKWFISHRNEIEKMGQECLKLCWLKFDVNKVNVQIMKSMT